MAKFGVKEVADVTFYSLTSNKPELYLDTLKMSSIENTAEQSSARGGKSNPKLLTWDFNRESTMSVQDALMSEKSIALLSGNPLTEGAKDIYEREVAQVTSVDTTAGTATIGVANTIASSASTTFAYDSSTSDLVGELTVNSVSGTSVVVDNATAGLVAGDQVTVYYRYASDATTQTIDITSDKFPGYFRIVGDTVIRNSATGVDEPFQIVIPKAKLQPGFTMTFQADGDPTVFDMNLEIFKADNSTSMIQMIKY